MLFEGVLRFSAMASRSIEENDIERRVYWINRCSSIFAELINSLDYSKGGNVAHYLSGIYTRQIQLLSLANLEHDKAYLEEVMDVTKELLEAWKDETDKRVD
jgi:flagellar protein FliS